MRRFLSFGLLMLAAQCGRAANPTFDVLAIAGKTKQQVTSALGKPLSCVAGKYGEKCRYSKGEAEVVFINGKADWITVEAMDAVNFDDAAVTALGFRATKPTFKNKSTIRWESAQGIREISVFPAGAKVDYAYIKVYTK